MSSFGAGVFDSLAQHFELSPTDPLPSPPISPLKLPNLPIPSNGHHQDLNLPAKRPKHQPPPALLSPASISDQKNGRPTDYRASHSVSFVELKCLPKPDPTTPTNGIGFDLPPHDFLASSAFSPTQLELDSSFKSPTSDWSHTSREPLTPISPANPDTPTQSRPRPRPQTQIKYKSKSPSLYSIGLTAVTFVQSIVVVAILAYSWNTLQKENVSFDNQSNYTIVSAYLVIFIIAAGLSFILVLESLVSQNVIQLVALCVFNLLMTSYGAVLPSQLDSVYKDAKISEMDKLHGCLQVIPSVMGACTLLMAILTVYVHKEFGWDIYKQMGANMQLKRVVQQRAIFSISQKFNTFFFVGAMIQYAVLSPQPGSKTALEALALISSCSVIMISSTVAIKEEIRWPLWISHIGSAAAMSYMIYLLAAVVPQPQFAPGRRTLRFFLILSFLNLIYVVVLAEVCARTFGLGMLELKTRRWWWFHGRHKPNELFKRWTDTRMAID